jgi:C4-dicarboxylate transporter, DctM subunit
MTPLAIGALGLGALLVLILAQVPIGFAMIIVGVVGVALQTNWNAALTLLANEPVSVLSNIELATVPLFLLMGTFATMAGFSQEIYAAVAAFFGHRRGGLAYATIGGSRHSASCADRRPRPPRRSPGSRCRKCSIAGIRRPFQPARLRRVVR